MGTVVSNIIYTVSITVCLLLGACFFVLPTPKVPLLKNYKRSKKIIGLSYLLLGGVMLVEMMVKFPDTPCSFLAFSALMISSSQACLFTFTLLVLLNPGLVSVRYVFRQLLPLLLLVASYTCSSTLFGDPEVYSIKAFVQQWWHPSLLIRLLFFGFYVYQLVYYTCLFVAEKRAFQRKIYDYYSDNVVLKMNWVTCCFYAALVVGMLAMASYFFPTVFYDNFFVAFYTLFYAVFALNYLDYSLFYTCCEIVLKPSDEPVEDEEEETACAPEKHIALEAHFERLMSVEKVYLNKRLTSEELASMLCTNRKYVSELINRKHQVNFNTYINQLRVADAQLLLLQQPELSILEIAEKVGFMDVSHFCRQFKKITGHTSSTWRKQVQSR